MIEMLQLIVKDFNYNRVFRGKKREGENKQVKGEQI